jgi:hypothetical protein
LASCRKYLNGRRELQQLMLQHLLALPLFCTHMPSLFQQAALI